MSQWSNRYLYTQSTVQTYAPSTQGLYRLSIGNRIFYVGQSKNLRTRLLEHFNQRERNRCLKRHLKTYRCFFRFLILDCDEQLIAAERQQIRKFKPTCNMDIRTIEEAVTAPTPLMRKLAKAKDAVERAKILSQHVLRSIQEKTRKRLKKRRNKVNCLRRQKRQVEDEQTNSQRYRRD